MKTLVLDATELRKDWLCVGLKFQLLGHMIHQTLISAYVPASVFEEVIAHHGRAVEDARRKLDGLIRDRRMLGLAPVKVEEAEFNYRSYLVERFDTVLGITIMDWPKVSHRELVGRAVNRTPPFDQKGSGYRDSLVWASAMELARSGHNIALASEDKIFAGQDDTLAPSLKAEIADVTGKVELVRDLGAWLLSQLPWTSKSLEDAVARGHDEEFYQFFLQSDLAEELVPEIQDLGFRRAPYFAEVVEVKWGGMFVPLGGVTAPNGLVVAEYDIDQIIEFEATLPEGSEIEEAWETSGPDYSGRLSVRGQIRMIVRLAVLFGDEFGITVDEVSWRRADGSGPGTLPLTVIPGQLSLFDSAASEADPTS